MGCLITFISMEFLCNCFKTKSSIIPAMIGSVGKLKPSPPSKSCKFTAKGVRKTTNRTSLSNEKNASRPINKTNGRRFK